MAFGIFFLSYTQKLCIFLFHVILYGCFCFLLCLLEFSLNDHTLEEVNFDLMCVWTGAGCCDLPTVLFFFFFKVLFEARSAWVLPRCCHSETQSRNTHIANISARTTASPPWAVSHYRLEPSPFHLFLSSLFTSLSPVKGFLETLGEIALLSALCMFFRSL